MSHKLKIFKIFSIFKIFKIFKIFGQKIDKKRPKKCEQKIVISPVTCMRTHAQQRNIGGPWSAGTGQQEGHHVEDEGRAAEAQLLWLHHALDHHFSG